jgi:cytidyltransferase-like protein
MSGVSGSNRITRKNFPNVLKDYENKVLKNIPGYKSLEISGSYNSDKSKNDFGDMDIITHFETHLDKKELKKQIAEYFKSLPDNVAVPFTSDKYKGRKYYNSGEIVTINYPQPDGTVQIDNIIALDKTELKFKKEFLDMPAEKQGLVLGLIKIAIQENDPQELISRLGIKVPEIESNEKYEFNLSSVELSLRAVVEEEINGRIKQTKKRPLWKSRDWKFVGKILSRYKLDTSFEDLVQQAETIVRDRRGLQRIVGIFKSMITVKSGEVGTPKGVNKEKAIKRIEKILESKPLPKFKRFLNEKVDSVGLFVGRFQPLTKAHTDIIETIAKENDKGIIFLVKAKKKDVEKSPFDEEIQKRLLNEIIPKNIDIVVLPSGYFVDYINELPYSTFNIYAGTDRVSSYDRFSQYMADDKTLTAKEIKRSDEDISATKVRNALKSDDRESFEKLTDKRIHKYYDELRGSLFNVKS